MFAVVLISGKQYKVSPHDVIEVDRIETREGQTVSFDKVLLVSDGKETQIGTPYLTKIQVKAKVLGDLKGEKIHVMRYKSKVRYRRRIGFRPLLTKLEIEAIG